MNELCIISCGKKKIWDKDISAGPVKSKDLYTGSFTVKCIQYAEKFHKNSYRILSAKFGLLSPDEIIRGHYNECFHLEDTNPISKEALILQINAKKLNEYEKIVILGGKFYTKMVKDLFPKKEIYNPLEGCRGIGKMMKKLDGMIKNN